MCRRATLMVVENAERFGLSQLHQLRGRVGRGSAKSWCILMSDTKNEKSRERLAVMEKSSNGFDIAEEDLRLRGPGDFLGRDGEIRQSGEADLGLGGRLHRSGAYRAGIAERRRACRR